MNGNRTGPLPDFIIVGAAKAATTWVHNQLLVHPDVFLPGPEPHFFSRQYERGEAWYRAWFEAAAEEQTVGEKSADYLASPYAAERIFRMIPSARIIVQLRNPIERAYSDYCMFYRRGAVNGRIDRYLGSLASPEPRFLNDSLYYRHLSRFLQWFPASQIKVILHDDIRERPEDVVTEVTAFLGLQQLQPPIPLVPQVNAKDAPMLPLALRRTLAPAKNLVAPLRPHRWFQAIRGTLASQVVYPPLSSELRDTMRDYFAGDIENLGRLLGRDLSHWLSDADLS